MLKASASWANSLRPRTVTRLDRSPWVILEMPWLSSSMGRVKMRETIRLRIRTDTVTSRSHSDIWRCICVRLWYTSWAMDEYTTAPTTVSPDRIGAVYTPTICPSVAPVLPSQPAPASPTL